MVGQGHARGSSREAHVDPLPRWHASRRRRAFAPEVSRSGMGRPCSVLAAALAACATPVRRDAVPLALTDRATVLGGAPDARYWVDTQVPDMAKMAAAALERERASLGYPAHLPPANFLAISGGGDNGAFGAGLLNGWTAAGDPPRIQARHRHQHRSADRAHSPSSAPSYDATLYATSTPPSRRGHLPVAEHHCRRVFSDALRPTPRRSPS